MKKETFKGEKRERAYAICTVIYVACVKKYSIFRKKTINPVYECLTNVFYNGISVLMHQLICVKKGSFAFLRTDVNCWYFKWPLAKKVYLRIVSLYWGKKWNALTYLNESRNFIISKYIFNWIFKNYLTYVMLEICHKVIIDNSSKID